jgi:signal transduction histidine kinase/DNA-binding response OmpR family regulator
MQFWLVGGFLVVLAPLNLSIAWRVYRQTATLSNGFIIILNLLLSSLAILTLISVFRSTDRPLKTLLNMFHMFQQGKFNVRVPVTQLDTIGRVQAGFNEMAAKIEMMTSEMVQLDRLKSEFLATVSHELRTPLTSIGGYAKLLLAGDVGPISEIQAEFLSIIDTNVVRLTHLINDILDVEALESGKVEVVRVPVHLGSVLKECVDTLRVVAKQKGLEFIYEVPEDLKQVSGDRSRFVQIFMNLIANAIKYTNTGFVAVRAEQNELTVTVKVSDSGIGLSVEDQGKIFQKFYRGNSPLAASEGGTGLGLVIVRNLVESFGGTVSVHSSLGKGTQFSIALPAITAAPKNTVGEPEVDEISVRRIWIIDSAHVDGSPIRKLLDSQDAKIEGMSIEVFEYTGWKDVPRVIGMSNIPSLVIVDPQGNLEGFTMTQKIRDHLKRPVPILLVSSTVDVAAALAEGVSAILPKPIVPAEFLAAVKSLIALKGWRILLADHNTDLRILLKRQFEKRGISIEDVDRGSFVLGHIKNEKYDIILIEKNLPDISGLDLLRVIRKDARYLSVPVFIMDEGNHHVVAEQVVQGNERIVDQNFHVLRKYEGVSGIVKYICGFLEGRADQ